MHRVVRTHLATFLERAAELGDSGVPRFVEKELRGYLRCGVLAHGFCRVQCGGCSYEHLVPLSCKGRAICSSCGGKRMTELAQRMTEQMIPYVPVRQFVLSLPHRLRYALAYDHARSLGVLRVVLRAVFDFYKRSVPYEVAAERRTGSVTFLQRFGSAANLNLHFHILVLDGVFTDAPDHTLRFHPAPAPTDQTIARLLATIQHRVLRHIARWGPSEDVSADADHVAHESPLLAACYASSIARRRTLGLRAGAPLDRPIAHDRLSEGADGRIALRLKTPWSDGTTHVVYEPLDLVAKLAALIPRPHKNLVLYHGVLAANSSWRKRVVAHGRGVNGEASAAAVASTDPDPPDPPSMRPRRGQWADLMRHAFGYDLLSCPRCGCKMKLLACILDRESIRKILTHRGLNVEPPSCAAASGVWQE